MILNVGGVMHNEGQYLPIDCVMPVPPDFDDTAKFCDLHVKGGVKNAAGAVTISFTADTVMRVPCDRCLEETEISVSAPFQAYLVFDKQNEDDETLLIVENERIDLLELALGAVFLELPAKRLCREDCKGMCQRCGANFNFEKCDCSESVGDPRFQKLSEYKFE